MSSQAKMNFQSLMSRWESLLRSYGTPENFGEDTVIRKVETDGKGLELLTIVAPNFEKRRELMKGLPPSPSGCFLCDNIKQSEERGDNLASPFNSYGRYVFVPNRFPMTRGCFLLIAKDHNSPESRNLAVTPEYLKAIKQASDRYDLFTLRNHEFAGMSIPDHEHVHLLPQHIQIASGEEINFFPLSKCDLFPTEYGPEIYALDRTELDTIAFIGDSAPERLTEVVRKLEKAGKIFTFAYSRTDNLSDEGAFFLTPHKQKGLSGGAPLYHYHFEGNADSYRGRMDFLKRHIYTKGEFNWKDFLK